MIQWHLHVPVAGGTKTGNHVATQCSAGGGGGAFVCSLGEFEFLSCSSVAIVGGGVGRLSHVHVPPFAERVLVTSTDESWWRCQCTCTRELPKVLLFIYSSWWEPQVEILSPYKYRSARIGKWGGWSRCLI